eukprot:5121049-Prymnesium_polylepis.1
MRRLAGRRHSWQQHERVPGSRPQGTRRGLERCGGRQVHAGYPWWASERNGSRPMQVRGAARTGVVSCHTERCSGEIQSVAKGFSFDVHISQSATPHAPVSH